WTEYVKTGATTDTTPPPAPFNVVIQATATGVEVTWDAHADLESGLRQFIVKRDGQAVGLVVGPKNPFGRAVFQGMSYGDTPAQPLSAMRYSDTGAKPGAKYEVIAVNGVGRESAPSK
ncbi:MAG: hypothetical protein EBV31_08515, partial [Verrucomicrobia bacterium]|nr:hypothetical protein [Verrucomicrobiota bacterium]